MYGQCLQRHLCDLLLCFWKTIQSDGDIHVSYCWSKLKRFAGLQDFYITTAIYIITCEALKQTSRDVNVCVGDETQNCCLLLLSMWVLVLKIAPSPSLQAHSLPFHTGVLQIVTSASFTHDSWLPGWSEVGQNTEAVAWLLHASTILDDQTATADKYMERFMSSSIRGEMASVPKRSSKGCKTTSWVNLHKYNTVNKVHLRTSCMAQEMGSLWKK